MGLNKRRAVENGIRALLREVGLKLGTPSRKDFAARVRVFPPERVQPRRSRGDDGRGDLVERPEPEAAMLSGRGTDCDASSS